MNANDILKYGQGTVFQAIEGLPESAWETPGACGVWSIKDIIAHLASYEHVLVDVLSTFVGGGSTPYLSKFTDPDTNFNDSEVAARKGKSVRDVLDELTIRTSRLYRWRHEFPWKRSAKLGHSPGTVWSMHWTILLSIPSMGINASTVRRLLHFAITSEHNL